ncbi:MAG: hypothetical protein KIT11_04885 [Fimbriimonadaceae bacterium]|nr:hypothetical protein [Fimbriimonadaceae bacterium]QYK56770.1 MAG: hypothetical protein KF733_04635 [Fimbriimonadaceae bacterium]
MGLKAFINSRSRRGHVAKGEVASAAADFGLALETCEAVVDLKELAAGLRAAIAEKDPYVFVGGGDGTLGFAAQILKNSGTALAVVPLGTGNAFAQDLELPVDVRAAVQVAATGTPQPVDVGVIEGRTFVNFISCGLPVAIADSLDSRQKRTIGRLAYVSAFFRALREMRPFDATIELNSESVTFETILVVAGVGRRHAGPFVVAPDAQRNDGQFTIYAITGSGRGQLLRLFLALLIDRHTELPDVFHGRTENFKFKTSRPKRVAVDGEPVVKTPVEARIEPGALLVMQPVPRQEEEPI